MVSSMSFVDLQASDAPIIACDLDDVLSSTNTAVAEWHNDTYGTSMDLSMFLYYYYWRNPFWGNPEETKDKVNEFYKTDRLDTAMPVKGALEGAQKLKQLGFKLVVVTARQIREQERSLKWLGQHFPGVFETIICTGQSQETIFDHGLKHATKLTKAQVCKEINARVLIDDSLENALSCATGEHPVTTLLFGDYEWSKRRGKLNEAEEMSYEEKSKLEKGRAWWKDDEESFPQDGIPLYRASNWEEVVVFVAKAKAEGTI